MSRIDYSKWDNIGDSDSSDDDEEEERTSAMPRVTRLEEPSQVSFGGPNNTTTTNTSACIDITPTSAQSTPSAPSHRHHGNKNTSTHSSASNSVSSWTDRGGMVELEPHAAHNEEAATTTTRRKLYWSQDRYSVTLRVQLHDKPLDGGDEDAALLEGEATRWDAEKIDAVGVEGIVPYANRYCATGTARPILRCHGHLPRRTGTPTTTTATMMTSVVLFEGVLPHPVHLEHDDEGEQTIDWSVVMREHEKETVTTENENEEAGTRSSSRCRRFLMITLYKAVPMQGMFVWWRRPLMQFPELALEHVKQDTNSTSSTGSDSNTSKDATAASFSSHDFLQAWDEAHKLFKETKRMKQTI